jgi:hypothetical protein
MPIPLKQALTFLPALVTIQAYFRANRGEIDG